MSYFDLTLFGFNVAPGIPALLLTLVVLLLVLYFSTRPPAGLPPLPAMLIPILGNYLSIGKDKRVTFRRWRKKHGDMFSLYFGPKLIVVLNGFDVMKEAAVKYGHVFSDRPYLPFYSELLKGKGILASSGASWKCQRNLCMNLLREFGFGRYSMEAGILEEIKHLLKYFESTKGEKHDFSKIYSISTSNVICITLFGHRFEYEDKNFTASLESLDTAVADFTKFNLLNYLPYLMKIPTLATRLNNYFDKFAYFEKNLIETEIKQHLDEYDGTTPDFVAAYIKEIKERESAGVDVTDLKDNLTQTVEDFFGAGTITTTITLKWITLFLIRFPEVQEKCFNEIKDNVGLDRLPTLKDKPGLPYLEAVIAESQRKANILPFSVVHSTSQDTTFRGFTIPKETLVVLNLDSVLMDPEQWSEPEEFRPERFLDESGAFSKPESFIPFSLGRRVCLGENLAKMELFLFSAALIQTFKLVSPDDEPTPSLESRLNGIVTPQPYNVKALLRNSEFLE